MNSARSQEGEGAEPWLIGTVLKPKGLKGEVKVMPVTDYPETFLSRKEVLAGPSPRSAVRLLVKRAALSGGFAWMFFEGIDSREKAEAIAGHHLYIREKDAVAPAENRAWLHELVGMRVLDAKRSERGVVTDVLRMPAHEVYEVRLPDGKQLLLPAIDEFVEELDVEGGFMVVPRFDEFI